MRKFRFLLVLACLATPSTPLAGKETGLLENRPELESLSKTERVAWKDYFKRSHYWAQIDRDFIAAELKKTVYKEPTPPPAAAQFGFDAKQPAEFYKTPAGQKIAGNILSFQTPSGGWSKRTDMSLRPRKPAEAFGTEPAYIPTFDNRATTTQLRVLALAFQATGKIEYANAFLKGLNLILQAQFPNGGWPQNYPLTGGYHDYITYNDEVVIHNLSLLHEVAEKQPPFDFVPEDFHREAAASLKRGIECLLKTQVVTDGKKTAWGAQHDALTLAPQAARAFEPVALASQESSHIVDFLMQLRNPSGDIIAAVDAAVAWFNAVRIMGYKWNFVNGESATLEAAPGAGPVWARFYEIGSNKPLFGDRDGSVHYDVTEISRERRIKYAWYTETPIKRLARYEEWKKQLKKSKIETGRQKPGVYRNDFILASDSWLLNS
jgi:PelA/Pel-15E family pectate lyase